MARALKFRFTPAFINGLKKAEPGKRYYRWCDSKPHFGIRVTDNGAKSFIVVARRAGQYNPHTHVIGPCAEWTMDDALAQVDGIIAQLRLGKNPKHEAKKSVEDTFEKAVEAFLARKNPRCDRRPPINSKVTSIGASWAGVAGESGTRKRRCGPPNGFRSATTTSAGCRSCPSPTATSAEGCARSS